MGTETPRLAATSFGGDPAASRGFGSRTPNYRISNNVLQTILAKITRIPADTQVVQMVTLATMW